MIGLATLAADIVLVHSSDLHVDDDPHQGPYGEDGTAGLRVVLDVANAHNADYVLLVGDTFDNNRQSSAIVSRCVSLLHGAGRPVIVLPGNPAILIQVWR
jgi:DNA repair exonuclease SbcCD nuclease subunit